MSAIIVKDPQRGSGGRKGGRVGVAVGSAGLLSRKCSTHKGRARGKANECYLPGGRGQV